MSVARRQLFRSDLEVETSESVAQAPPWSDTEKAVSAQDDTP